MLELNWKCSQTDSTKLYTTVINLNEIKVTMEVEVTDNKSFAVFSVEGRYSDQCTLEGENPVEEAEQWLKHKLFSIRSALQEPELEAFLTNP